MATAATAHRVGNHNLHAGLARRSKGHSATRGAAYIQRCRIRDERTGEVYDYSRHPNRPLFTGFFAPAHAPEWAQTEEGYWNGVEIKENRSDSQLARNFIITLPHELQDHPDGIKHAQLALTEFAREQFQRKGYGVSLAIHPAHEHGDDRNLHAHMQVSLRKIERDGSWARHKDPAEPDLKQLEEWKERCAAHLNNKLERFGYDIRVDHRSLEERGTDREPQVKLGPTAAALERQGIHTDKGDINREIEARNQQRLRREAQELVSEYQAVSAIDRQRDEDREAEQRQRPGLDQARRGLLSALWTLTRTMGGSLSHIVLGADRGQLMQGRSVLDEQRQAEKERDQAERQAERERLKAAREWRETFRQREAHTPEAEQPRQFVDRGQRPAPYHTLVEFPRPDDRTPPAAPDTKQPSFLDTVMHQEAQRRASLTPQQRQAEDRDRLRKELERARDDDWDLSL